VLARKIRELSGVVNRSQSPTLVTAASGAILGTEVYMSPEHAKGREADRTTDVWAFGCADGAARLQWRDSYGHLGPRCYIRTRLGSPAGIHSARHSTGSKAGPLGEVIGKGGANQLWRMPADGGQAEPLTKGDDRVRHMFYSPDGRWLYFQPNHLNIYRMPADGGPVQQVTHFQESGLFLEEPTISPDGRYLVYCRSNGGSSLWVLRLGNVQTEVQ